MPSSQTCPCRYASAQHNDQLNLRIIGISDLAIEIYDQGIEVGHNLLGFGSINVSFFDCGHLLPDAGRDNRFTPRFRPLTCPGTDFPRLLVSIPPSGLEHPLEVVFQLLREADLKTFPPYAIFASLILASLFISSSYFFAVFLCICTISVLPKHIDPKILIDELEKRTGRYLDGYWIPVRDAEVVYAHFGNDITEFVKPELLAE